MGLYVDVANLAMNGGYGMRYDVLREFACRDSAEPMRLNAYVSFDAERAEFVEERRCGQQIRLEHQRTVRAVGAVLDYLIVLVGQQHPGDEPAGIFGQVDELIWGGGGEAVDQWQLLIERLGGKVRRGGGV